MALSAFMYPIIKIQCAFVPVGSDKRNYVVGRLTIILPAAADRLRAGKVRRQEAVLGADAAAFIRRIYNECLFIRRAGTACRTNGFSESAV